LDNVRFFYQSASYDVQMSGDLAACISIAWILIKFGVKLIPRALWNEFWVYICPKPQYFVTQVVIQQLFNKSNIVVGLNHGGIIAVCAYVCWLPRLYAQGNGIYNYSELLYNNL
jgi:hypothetical protein